MLSERLYGFLAPLPGPTSRCFGPCTEPPSNASIVAIAGESNLVKQRERKKEFDYYLSFTKNQSAVIRF